MTTRHEFLKALFEFCGGDLELRAIQDGKEPHRTFCKLGDHKAVDGFCKAHPDRNIYFTIATRNNGGTKDHIQDIPALWCDLDFKNTPKQDADKRLADFPLKMSFCIASGHGYHCYWQLKEPYGKDDIPAIEALLKQLAASLHGDTAATDASRVLRLPDTANVKDPKIPKPVKCILARDLKYDLSDFDFCRTQRKSATFKGALI